MDSGEADDCVVPVALQVEMILQPANELDGALGEALDGRIGVV